MKTYKFIFVMFLIPLAYACSKDDTIDRNQKILNLGGDTWAESQIDKWIYTNYVKDYNMDVKYKWDPSELDVNYAYVPIDEYRVVPFMSAVKRTWIDPYEALAGSDFIKKLSPKKFVLVGSPKYKSNGTITLGEAEGGRKVVLYRLNWYDPADKDLALLQAILKTVHHEFCHTLNQTIVYPVEFMYITPSGYNSSWENRTDDGALQLGFISPYAGASPDEDIAEMLARIVIYGRPWYEARVARAALLYKTPVESAVLTYDPAAALRAKEAILVKYMRDVWGVYLNDNDEFLGSKGLITRVQDALALEIAQNSDK